MQEHRQHHGTPIASHYCLLSGAWNGPLDRSGVFAAVERLIHARTGVRPRSWESRPPQHKR
jgi:ubiquitin-conjugating enzyme E2 variant